MNHKSPHLQNGDMNHIPYILLDVDQSKKIMCVKYFESFMVLYKNKAFLMQGNHVFLWRSEDVCGLLLKICNHQFQMLQRLYFHYPPHEGEAEGPLQAVTG